MIDSEVDEGSDPFTVDGSMHYLRNGRVIEPVRTLFYMTGWKQKVLC